MDLARYSLEEVFQAAIMSETESERIYLNVASSVRNAFLKEKLSYLAAEENKHRKLLEQEFKKHLPGRELTLPEKCPVPLPDPVIPDEGVPLSEVIDGAMTSERAAKDFYLSMKMLFDSNDDIRIMLDYFARMEEGHFHLLSVERENLAQFEEYDSYWEMMNIGP